MNLIVDVGNTAIKLAIFSKQEMLHKISVGNEVLLQKLEELFLAFPKISFIIISSVGKLSSEAQSYLNKQAKVHLLSHVSKVPFENKYSTPTTLGVDRIALASAACYHYPFENVLVIDAGTCITYDVINDKKQYLGGVISPGVSMRYQSMHSFTANLPLLEPKNLDFEFGSNTNESIHAGVIHAIGYEIDGFIKEIKEKYNPLKVIFTGGDALFLRDRIKNDIFAHSNFLLEGLNYLLEINKDSC